MASPSAAQALSCSTVRHSTVSTGPAERSRRHRVDHDAYLVKPLLVLLTYGCLPAFLLGCVVVLLFVGARRR